MAFGRLPDDQIRRIKRNLTLAPHRMTLSYGNSLMRARAIFRIEQSLTNTTGWF